MPIAADFLLTPFVRAAAGGGGKVGKRAVEGVSRPTESVSVVMVPPPSEGRPTASSQTVPWMMLLQCLSFGSTVVGLGRGRGPKVVKARAKIVVAEISRLRVSTVGRTQW
jgi:hypothetical protein